VKREANGLERETPASAQLGIETSMLSATNS
jgi:hypothetical protein